jgi:hypothetical protein
MRKFYAGRSLARGSPGHLRRAEIVENALPSRCTLGERAIGIRTIVL